MRLGVIVCGQIRSFFIKSLDIELLNMLERSGYDVIEIVFVINDNYNQTMFDKFKKYNLHFIDYRYYIEEHNKNHIMRLKNQLFIYNHSKLYRGKTDILDGIKQHTMQFNQLQLGIHKLKSIEEISNFKFDIIMKTRFDIHIPSYFVPLMREKQETFIKKINQNDVLLKRFNNKMNALNWHESEIEEHLKKKESINKMNTQSFIEYQDLTFGATNVYNYLVLNRIRNGSNNIIYAFRDYLIFGSRDDFIKLERFYDEYCLCKNYHNVDKRLIPECEIIAYALYNNIDLLMYPDGDFTREC